MKKLTGILFFSAMIVGCNGGEGPIDPQPKVTNEAPPVCEAGRATECPCVGDTKGVQSCADDGSKWGQCECVDPATMTPQALCSGVITVDEAAAGSQCPRDKNKPFKSCPLMLVMSGVCVADATFFCCAG